MKICNSHNVRRGGLRGGKLRGKCGELGEGGVQGTQSGTASADPVTIIAEACAGASL
jgi:hypothetical protein